MALNQKHFQFLRRGGLESLTAAKSAMEAQLSGASTTILAGEPIIAYYNEGNEKRVLLGIGGGSGDTYSGSSMFYNAAHTDELISKLEAGLTGEDSHGIDNLTIKGLKNAIEAASGKLTLTSSDKVLTVTTNTSGTVIDITYDGVTIKSSDGGVEFENGEKIASGTLYSADAIIENGFKVLGATVGQLTPGTAISGGTTVIELLKQMLVKTADCTASVPTCTLNTLGSYSGTYEVGEKITFTLGSSYQDGKFKYAAADYGTATDTYKAAGCVASTPVYTLNGVTLESVNVDNYELSAGTTTFAVTCGYAASTFVPNKNDGSTSSVSIAAGTTSENSRSITADYKWFVGNTEAESLAALTNADIIGAANKTFLSSAKKISGWESSGKSIFVAVPKGYKLSNYMQKSPEASLLPNFTLKEERTVTLSTGASKAYNVYLWVITSGAKIKAGDITITTGTL